MIDIHSVDFGMKSAELRGIDDAEHLAPIMLRELIQQGR
jgi:hypothetical protein